MTHDKLFKTLSEALNLSVEFLQENSLEVLECDDFKTTPITILVEDVKGFKHHIFIMSFEQRIYANGEYTSERTLRRQKFRFEGQSYYGLTSLIRDINKHS